MNIKKIELLEKVSERTFDINETMKVLKTRMSWLMSWGAHDFENHASKALVFKVSGIHFKGNVIITLAFDDTYTITFASSQWNLKEVIKDVYFDVLTEVLDEKIERIEIYKS